VQRAGGGNRKRRRSQTVQGVEGDDAVSTWPVTLLLTAKMWSFLTYVACLYRCNSTAIRESQAKNYWTCSNQGMFCLHCHYILSISQWVDITAIRASQTAVTRSPNSRPKETNITDHLSKNKVICLTVSKTGLNNWWHTLRIHAKVS